MKKIAVFLGFCLFMAACSSEPAKPPIPTLSPEVANQILRSNSKAAGWLDHAKKQDPSCAYDIDLPDQSNHPTQLDFTHVLKCGGRPAPLELDASVSFQYDPDTQHWVVMRFSD
jgi:hypothetical protein